MSYRGTSPSDIWSSGLAHWNGKTWTAVSVPGLVAGSALAGPGKLWVAGVYKVWRVDAEGTVEDFSSEFPVDNTTSPPREVHTGNGTTVVVVQGNNSGNSASAYLFDGAHFRKLDLPEQLLRVGVFVRGANDLYVTSTLFDGGEALGREIANKLWHYDGSRWTIGSGLPVDIASINPRFPANDAWIACSGSASPMHWDGIVVRKLGVPLPPDCTKLGYAKGRYTVVFPTRADPAKTPEAYKCDQKGNCTLLDIPGYTSEEYHRMIWDGGKWADDEVVARVERCVGPACGYGGGRSVGVVGDLEDGTQLFTGRPKASADAEAGPDSLFVIEP